MDDEPIGVRIRRERLEQGLSQLELCKRAGIDMKTLHSMETGRRTPLDTSLFKVENALGLGQKIDKPRRVWSARDLSDEELAAEVTYRLMRGSR